MLSIPQKVSVVRVDPHRPNWLALRKVASAIRTGRLVAAPTDTVYGLMVDPFQPIAVRRLFAAKQRPESNPILILIESYQQIHFLARNLPRSLKRVAATFWPGPLTIILSAKSTVSQKITAGTGTVAIRLPDAKITRSLIRIVGRPLTGTSANISGQPAAQTALEVRRSLGKRVHYIIDGGRSRNPTVSTILDLTGKPRIVREGAISWMKLEKCLYEDMES